jgi:hypothetical protein
LKEGSNTVSTFTNVTLANGASHTFEPVTTEVIGGQTYYVATLDPPAGPVGTGRTGTDPTGTGPTGASGHHPHGPADGRDPKGWSDPLTAPINPSNLFGSDHQPKFLQVTGRAVIEPGTAGGAPDVLIQGGTSYVQNFNVAQGDKLDLRQILAGTPLAHDLANVGQFVQVLGHGANDPGFGAGTKTSLEVIGPRGTAIVNLEGSGKLDLHDLLKHNSLLLPPH